MFLNRICTKMVSMNLRYLSTLPGLLKSLTTFFLIISISLGGHAFDKSFYNIAYRFLKSMEGVGALFPTLEDTPGLEREQCFLAFTSIILMVSVLSLLCHISNADFQLDSRVKIFDILFYTGGALFLLIAGSLIIDSSRKIEKECVDFDKSLFTGKCQYRAEKDFAGIFALMTSALYGLIAVMQVLRFGSSESTIHDVVS